MRFATGSNTRRFAQFILITIATALSVAALMEPRRPRRTPQVCRVCAGFGNSSGSADDVDTVCDACGGTGWTDSRGLHCESGRTRLSIGTRQTVIHKFINGHANNSAANGP